MAVGHQRIMTEDQEGELMDLRAAARKAEEQHEAKAEAAKTAKKRMEAAQDAVSKFLDDLENPTPRLPFKAEPESVPPIDAASPSTPDDVAITPPEDGEAYKVVENDERWRLVPIADLKQYGIKPGDIKKLAEATPPITTMGELADYTANGEKQLKDIPGIGEAARDRITDAVIGWHEANRKPTPSTSPQNASEGGDDKSIHPDPENAADGGVGDSTGVVEPSAADEKPVRKRKPRKDPDPIMPIGAPGEFKDPGDPFEPPSDSFEPPKDYTPDADSGDEETRA